jgi:hypothetical protein
MNRAARRAIERAMRRPAPARRFRPTEPLTATQIRDLSLCHLVNLDAIAAGGADETILWQWAGSVFTWSRAAELTTIGIPEMAAQLALAESVVERWRRTGRVGFSGTEYQRAKDGVAIMDELARVTPRRLAVHAANWSENRMNELTKEIA